jgi:maltose alpha-D-glucosyltransferase/alpha-amylase
MRTSQRAALRRRVWLVVLAVCCGPAVARGQAPAAPAKDPAYVRWLEERSMLFQAARVARHVSGSGVQWRHPYGEPQPRAVVRKAPVWVLDWPGSVIPRPGQSVLATWGDPELWDAFRDLGIDLLHTGPVNRSGGIEGRDYTPSIDGWFDPIALEIDPQLGTEEEYRRMVRAAAERGGLIAGDLVPLHTGKGADFRLAQMGYKDYPGMYTMVEVRKEDWPLLPRVDGPWAGAPVPKDAAERLTQKGYLPGLINNNDAVKNARDLSGWAASGEVVGVDGKVRRWVYLHYFKPGQPTLNWLDPSCAGPRAVIGDLTRTVHGLGARVVRFDAVPFLGIEPEPGKALSKHYQHPLSVTATNQLAFLARKLGGWSFHELNVPLVELKKFTQNGPDLSYDFFTRAQCLHALLTGNAAPLRQAFGFLLEAGVQPLTLVHDLQNHDEITYQLVELDHRKDETFTLGGTKVTGRQLRERLLREMREKAAGPAAPHNKLYRPEQDGVATTFAGFVAAALEIRDPYRATADQVEQIRRGHLLLALANAMQPGVFSLSSWDLVGALPIDEEAVAKWTEGGDFRWVNRGGVDLMGANPEAKTSAYGLPRAQALYGPLPQQLRDPNSFASRLKRVLAARKECRIAEGELLAVPEVKNPGVCLLVLRLPERDAFAVTALNFSRSAAEEEIDLTAVPGATAEKLRGRRVVDAVEGKPDGTVTDRGRLTVSLAALSGKTLVMESPSR